MTTEPDGGMDCFEDEGRHVAEMHLTPETRKGKEMDSF